MGPLSGNSRPKSHKSTENANNLLASPDFRYLRGRSRRDDEPVRENRFKLA